MMAERIRTKRTVRPVRRRGGLFPRSGGQILAGAALVVVLAVAALAAGMWAAGRAGTSAEADETGTTSAQVARSEASAPGPGRTGAEARSSQGLGLDLWVRVAAREDADLLTAAHEAADEADEELATTLTVVQAHQDTVSGPVHDLVVAHAEAFGPEVVDVLSAVIDLASTQVQDAALRAGHGDEAVATSAPAAPSHLSPTVTDRADALLDHYQDLSDDDLQSARAAVAREVDRLTAVAEERAEATLVLRAQLQALDEALVGVLLAAEGVGGATLQSLSHSSEEAADDLEAAVAELSRLSEVPLTDADGEARSVEQPTVVVGVLEAVETYLTSDRRARSSHELHQPVPEEPVDPAPDPDPDPGGGGGGAGYACYRWSPWGSYIGWCY